MTNLPPFSTGSAISITKNLSCGYKTKEILTNINLEFCAGQVVAIIGPNGSGKTTLFRTIAGLLPPLSGEALIHDGTTLLPVYKVRNMERARIIARVMQSEYSAWNFTVYEYVDAGCYATKNCNSLSLQKEMVMSVMKLIGIEGFASRYIKELSGGEFRKVLIARALVQDAKLLLLDEPVGDLDIARQLEILHLLCNQAKSGKGVVISIHDINLASLVSDIIVLLCKGRIFAKGNPKDIITEENIFAVYGAQVCITPHPVLGLPQLTHLPVWKSL